MLFEPPPCRPTTSSTALEKRGGRVVVSIRVKVPSVLYLLTTTTTLKVFFFSFQFCGFLFSFVFFSPKKKKEALKGETDFDGSLCDDGGEEGEEDGWADAESDV